MNLIHHALSEFKLRTRVSRTLSEALQHRTPDSLQRVTELADAHPEVVLEALLPWLAPAKPLTSHAALLLLEHLVGACNYAFHLALARGRGLQERLLSLALVRAEDESHRALQRLARLTLLEYSRGFADDPALRGLAGLLCVFETRTGKSLLRCLNVQRRTVRFRKVEPGDYILLSPSPDSATPTEDGAVTEADAEGPKGPRRALAPLRLTAAEVWPCRVCGYWNTPSGMRCAACETTRQVPSPSPSVDGKGEGTNGDPTTESVETGRGNALKEPWGMGESDSPVCSGFKETDEDEMNGKMASGL
ncbi:unnamed protein product [Phytomonas sp. Hart1]|nr:unnamed protein product [Phytomonas sp. Hart1]|eukprot:CCW67935.1 unnamed protein product [Phytomonas sp. isolate Hart1]